MLDFYLLGVGRSGTSVFCQALNLHPGLYCGIERFPITQAPASIIFPDSFVDESIKENPLGLSHALEHLRDVEKRTNIKVIGDKSPRKFYCPSHLEQTAANILIYRSYTNTTASWDSRANNSEDAWSPSRTGYFFFFDLMLLFNALPFSNRLAIVDYDQLFFGDYAVELNHAFMSLDLDYNDYPVDLFTRELFSQKPNYKKTSLNPHYNSFAQHIGLDTFEKDFFSSDLASRFNLVKEYAEFIKASRARFFNDFIDGASTKETEELYWATSLIGKHLDHQDRDRFFSGIGSTFDLLLNCPADQTTDSLLKITTLYPQLGSAQLALSKRYLQKNELSLAIEHASRAIDTVTPNPHHYYYFGNLLMRTGGRWQDAVNAFESALRLDADYHPAFLRISQLYQQVQQYDNALQAINKAIVSNPANSSYYLQRGNIQLRRGEIDLACQDFHKTLELDPESAVAYVQLSHAYAQQQTIEKAIEALSKAIALDDGIAGHYAQMGNLQVSAGNNALARQAYHKAKQLDPTISLPHVAS